MTPSPLIVALAVLLAFGAFPRHTPARAGDTTATVSHPAAAKPDASRKPARPAAPAQKNSRPTTAPQSSKPAVVAGNSARRARPATVSRTTKKTTETAKMARRAEPVTAGANRLPSDPYRLIEHFPTLADLQRVVADTTGSRRYIEQAAAARLASAAAAFAAASDAAARRERNLASTMRALYIVGQANRTPVWLGTPLSTRHETAIRVSLRADARARDAGLQLIEQLRVATAEAAEHEATMRRLANWRNSREWWTTLVAPRLDPRAVTVSSLDAVRAVNEALLQAGGLSIETMELLDAAAAAARANAARTRLPALVLAGPSNLPAVVPFVAPDTPLPREDLPDRPAPQVPQLTTGNPLGMEIPIPAGETVRAAANGTVVFSGELRGARHIVIIGHDNDIYSVYSNLGARAVREGDHIRRGEPVGRPGPLSAQRDTGIHFEVRRGGKLVRPDELLGNTPAAKAVGGN